MRAKFFRVSALRPPLPCLRQFLFFSLAEFLKFSALDRFFLWEFASTFFIFPPLSEIFPNHSLSRFFSSDLLIFHNYIIHLFYYLVNTFCSISSLFCVVLLSFCVGILYNSVFRLCSIYCVIVHLYFKVA